MNAIEKYWNKIKRGDVLVSEKVKIVYQKNINLIRFSKTYIFDEDKANFVIDFIEQFCCFYDGKFAGKPFKLELWQKAALSLMYGIVYKKSGLRKYRETFLVVGRKNGKSPFAAAIELYHLLADGEHGGQIYCVATKKDQARIVFINAKTMAQNSVELRKHVNAMKTEITYDSTNSFIKALSSDSNTLDGLNISFAALDEMHAWKTSSLYDVITSATSAREQPMILIITTNGIQRLGAFDDRYDYSENIINGIIKDEAFLPLIYELDKVEEWTDKKMWIKPNPNLGVSKSMYDLEREFVKAKVNKKSKANFLTKHMNISTKSGNRFLSAITLNELNIDNVDVELALRNKYCTFGIDLSMTTDLTCAVLLTKLPNNKIFMLPKFFMAEDQAKQRELEDKIPYAAWEEEGYLVMTPGRKVDYTFVEDWMKKMVLEYGMTTVSAGYDPYNAQYFTLRLTADGFPMEEVRNGIKTISPAMKEFGAEFETSNIVYNNNPMLKWCFWNVSTKEDDKENIMPIKEVKRQRIDGFMAALYAHIVYQKNLDVFSR